MRSKNPLHDEELEQTLAALLRSAQAHHVGQVRKQLDDLAPEFELLSGRVQSRVGVDYLEKYKALKLHRNALIGQYKSVETVIGRSGLVRAMAAVIAEDPTLIQRVSERASTQATECAQRLAERRKDRWVGNRQRKRELLKVMA